ncbi:MAG: cytochrome c biogenesis protein [Flavobacteriales bacterium]
MNNIKKHWWKALAVIILLYTFAFSFLVPLSPNSVRIQSIDLINIGKTKNLDSLSPGVNNVLLTGYNTNFSQEDDIHIGVEFQKKSLICATDVKVLNQNEISFVLEIPKNLPKKYLNLRLHSNKYSFFSPEIISVFESDSIGNFSYCDNKAFDIKAPLLNIPNRLQLNETIRNLMFHVPMWFTMMIILIISFVNSLKYLNTFDIKYDILAKQAVNVGLLFAFLGLITGSIWAKFTWSEHTDLFTTKGWWVNDVKLNGAAITTLIYIAYLILRNSLEEIHQKAKISAVYNIFAFVLMVVLIMILPRLTDSLHPGNGGNPAFGNYDLDSTLKMVFYPAVIGWILIGVWIFQIANRLAKIKNKLDYED